MRALRVAQMHAEADYRATSSAQLEALAADAADREAGGLLTPLSAAASDTAAARDSSPRAHPSGAASSSRLTLGGGGATFYLTHSPVGGEETGEEEASRARAREQQLRASLLGPTFFTSPEGPSGEVEESSRAGREGTLLERPSGEVKADSRRPEQEWASLPPPPPPPPAGLLAFLFPTRAHSASASSSGVASGGRGVMDRLRRLSLGGPGSTEAPPATGQPQLQQAQPGTPRTDRADKEQEQRGMLTGLLGRISRRGSTTSARPSVEVEDTPAGGGGAPRTPTATPAPGASGAPLTSPTASVSALRTQLQEARARTEAAQKKRSQKGGDRMSA
jgi:hypothetical protein